MNTTVNQTNVNKLENIMRIKLDTYSLTDTRHVLSFEGSNPLSVSLLRDMVQDDKNFRDTECDGFTVITFDR